jgi:hypothetical protein
VSPADENRASGEKTILPGFGYSGKVSLNHLCVCMHVYVLGLLCVFVHVFVCVRMRVRVCGFVCVCWGVHVFVCVYACAYGFGVNTL